MKEVFVVEAARTPVARAGKQSWFTNVRADELTAIVYKELRKRCGLEDKKKQAEIIDDVVWATCANAFMEQGLNIGRLAWILSDGAYDVPGCTVDRFCASGIQSIQYAVSTMMCGWGGDVQFAGGVQHMTHIPMGAGADVHPDLGKYMDIGAISMGYTAEIVARRFNISREEQDKFAYESHMKCAKAQEKDKWKDVIIPIKAKVPAKSAKNNPNPFNKEAAYVATDHLAKARAEKGEEDVEVVVARDQGVRPETTLETLAAMPTVFMQDEKATVTAGNSSQINDAAAGVVLATEEGAKKLGLKPKMKLVSYAVIGLEPEIMGIGPALAIPKVLKRAGMTMDQIDLWEVNEAFASQSVYVKNTLKLPEDRLNIWGSGISIGHPLACTGARIACDITAILSDPDYADVEYVMESMCIGHGHGAAAIWQRVK
ncbi:thiolase family protein [Thermosyntropha sp.]|uniref:thiolase family protein n=1 Tax=Thermosyntropha sp. TaxID=2740820 RepID=UPI0025FA553E|nr:thiolase family protein [Thermosyntropha sp.]MBO8158699.1 thiolase family protein [Thermosyntropha sp.]